MSGGTDKLTFTEKVGYGFGDFASNLFWQMFSIFIAKFYTDVFLLGAATLGTMMLITRTADAVVDPLIGTLADRTNTRWGHFRPYLIWMAVPMAVSAVLTFTTPGFGGSARTVYAYVTLSLMMFCYSAINIPYSALLGVLTPDSEDRTSASSYRFVLAFMPIFIIAYATIPLATYFGGSPNSPRGWQMAMLVFSSVAVVFYFLTFFMTRERVRPTPKEAGSLAADLKDLLGNRPWVVLCLVGIAALTYGNIRNTVIVYYFQYVVPDGNRYFSSVISTGALAFILGVMLSSPLSKRIGKRRFYIASMSIATLLTIAYYWVPPDNLPLVWGGHALISLFTAPTAPLVWAMYADTADYSEWKNGRRATGLVFSAASFAQKFGWAIGGGGAGWLLAYFGYVPNVAQSARTVNGIMLMVTLIPAVAGVIAIATLFFYELDEPLVKKVADELAVRHGAAQERTERTRGAALWPLHARPAMRAGLSASPNPAWAAFKAAPEDGNSAAVLTETSRAQLAGQIDATLRARIHGFCFSPYLEGQSPGSLVSEAQIRARLEIIRPYTRWVRSFSCTDGHEHTGRIAHELGLKTLVGAWLGQDRAVNEREIEGLIGAARAGHADLLAVGNEVLLRGDLGEEELLGYIRRVKQALPGAVVGYADAYFIFEKHPRVVAACDVILANCYPFWEGCPIGEAIPYLKSMVERAGAAAAGKRVIVSETGWPHTGTAFHAAVPSAQGAMRYFVETNRWAAADGIEVFYFAAFDEAWKVGVEGDVGAYWGIWDKAGRVKYAGENGSIDR